MSKVEYTTIEQVHGDFWFCQHGVYERGSVLEGQHRRQLCEAFDTLEDAVSAHPEAEVMDCAYERADYMPEVAPEWFDPDYCGERWSEDY